MIRLDGVSTVAIVPTHKAKTHFRSIVNDLQPQLSESARAPQPPDQAAVNDREPRRRRDNAGEGCQRLSRMANEMETIFMKDTILNVVYDTDTAHAFGTREDNRHRSDDRWYRETLFRNRSGYWFLAGEGGRLTRYAVETPGGERRGSAGIIPIGRMQAMHWLARIGHVSALRDFFGGEKQYLKNEYQISL
jgi:hypothetical protein